MYLIVCINLALITTVEFPDTMGKICATGINSLELQYNDQLTGGYKQADLNVETVLPYPDNSFDVVTCVVSIDYMVDPISVLKEVRRVLRKGGKAIISQSNRCFPTSKCCASISYFPAAYRRLRMFLSFMLSRSHCHVVTKQ